VNTKREGPLVELRSGGCDDLDGSRTAAAVDAYVRAEQAIGFRSVLWRRLALFAAAWLIVGVATALVSTSATAIGFAMFAAAALWARGLEWRATKEFLRCLPSPDERQAGT
jgi:hypothetical protein